MKGSNSKSDVKAKAAFISNLEARGFQNAKVISSPCDISAEKDGEQWFFEIKMTTHKDTYFGAATMTEWEQAFKTPERFRFVIAIVDEAEDCGFKFIEMTPEEMMQYSTIPPFKVYFNINLEQYYGKESKPKNPKKANGKRKAIQLTEAIFNSIAAAFKGIRSQDNYAELLIVTKDGVKGYIDENANFTTESDDSYFHASWDVD